MSRPTRKVWRYIPQLVEMSELKKGDLFQMQKATPTDNVDEGQLLYALEDAKPVTEPFEPGATHEVLAGRFIADENFGKEKPSDG